MRPLGHVSLAVASAAAGLLAASVASGSESASRIIDRTVVCKMSGSGFPDAVRILTASATPLLPATKASPTTNVSNGDGTTGPFVGVGVRTGRAAIGGGLTTGEVRVTDASGTRCANSRLRIALSGRGPRGGPVPEIGASYRCNVPAKVVIRVRAIFKRPTSFKRDARFHSDVASGEITAGYLAVASLRGRRPIIFSSVHGPSGTARIFAAPGCIRNE